MEDSGAPADILLHRPWLPLSISGCQLLTKFWFGDSAYHILLTDMICVWEERMDSAGIQIRSQELNRRLRAPVHAFFSHLCAVVQPCLSGSGESDGEAKISLTHQENGDISMRLKSELAGLPFYWEFLCTPAPIRLVCAQLVRPLLMMSRLLQRQVDQLRGLIVRKDAEIQDYKENGATLSRERLQTDVFEEQTYRENFMAKTLPLVCSEQQDSLGFDDDLQQLYASIVAHRIKHTQKRRLSEEHSAEVDRSATEKPDLNQTSDVGHVHGETAEGREQSDDSQTDETRATVPQKAKSLPVTSDPTKRPSSKPKKKKVVGLFR